LRKQWDSWASMQLEEVIWWHTPASAFIERFFSLAEPETITT
jgi:hypothetical protein